MPIELYPHNQIAYKNSINLLEESGRAAVIHPTGTGKSFIAFKLAEDNPDAILIWLAPSEYIFQSQKENYLAAGGEKEVLSNIIFLTYSKLMYIMFDSGDDNDEIGKILLQEIMQSSKVQKNAGDTEEEYMASPDYIILDEFHRCGAESWGKCVEALIYACPETKVLGLSATHIRYLDNRRDMAEELFYGKVASKMELTEAIAQGILPAPLYICGLYEYRDEIRAIAKRVNSQRNPSIKDNCGKLLEKLKRAVSQAKGPEQIFAKYMKPNGKYIVFCSGREHMNEMIRQAGKWYGGIDKEPMIYRAIYDNSETPDEMKKFSSDDSDHLKLLFCVDMINEGVHVPDIDGAILLRPTASPALYLQQIGRALAVGDKRKLQQPIIFDMVDNFDSLKCIDSFLEAYHRVGGEKGNEKHKNSFEFRLVDEVRESRELFEKLRTILSSSWDACFNEAELYWHKYGSLKVPKSYITENGIALGSWLITQRRVRAGAVPGVLTEEQIEKLDSLGMEWDSSIGKAWERGYQELVQFKKENGHVDVPSRYVTESGYPLGKFVGNQRTAWKNSREESNGKVKLLKEREEKLDNLGFIWEKQRQERERYYEAAKAFYESEGHLNVPIKYETSEGLKLGKWLSNKQVVKRMLREDQLKELENMGMQWELAYDAKWEAYFQLARNYYEKNRNLDVPVGYTEDGLNLGRWISNLRSARERPESSNYKLTEERIKQLDSIGMIWAGDVWKVRYRLAEAYYHEHGDLKISQAYVVELDGKRIWLGKWLAGQKKRRSNSGQKHAMSEEQEKMLEAIGMEW